MTDIVETNQQKPDSRAKSVRVTFFVSDPYPVVEDICEEGIDWAEKEPVMNRVRHIIRYVQKHSPELLTNAGTEIRIELQS